VNAISNVSIRALPDTQTDIHPLKTIILFCAFVLGTLLCAHLRPGFERWIFLKRDRVASVSLVVC
jgi:hypothetical protein